MRLALALAASLAFAAAAQAQNVTLPRPPLDPASPPEATSWPATGKQLLRLDGIGARLEPLWRPVGSCTEVGYEGEARGEPYAFRLLYVYHQARGEWIDLACEMEEHGYFVAAIAQVRKPVWSEYDRREVGRYFTFFRVQDAAGERDFVLYHIAKEWRGGTPGVSGCDHENKRCYFSYEDPYRVIDLASGMDSRFAARLRDTPVENNPGMTTKTRFPEQSGPVAVLLGGRNEAFEAFVSRENDSIPHALALRALVGEVQRQYPEGAAQALDLPGRVRASRSGIVIEDIGANLGLAGTDASYVVRLLGDPDCDATENPDVRNCRLDVRTSVNAYDRRSGSRQTRVAKIANLTASGEQTGEIEALFIRGDEGWRMVVTEQIARFLSGTDRQNRWVLRTSDGRTLSGASAASCIANPREC